MILEQGRVIRDSVGGLEDGRYLFESRAALGRHLGRCTSRQEQSVEKWFWGEHFLKIEILGHGPRWRLLELASTGDRVSGVEWRRRRFGGPGGCENIPMASRNHLGENKIFAFWKIFAAKKVHNLPPPLPHPSTP